MRRLMSASMRGSTAWRRLARAQAQERAAQDADAEHVERTLIEIEQMRMEQRRDDILRDHDQAAPAHDPLRAKEQRQVRDPHGVHDSDTEQPELHCDRQRLLMRVLRDDRRGAAGADDAAKLLLDRAGAVTEHRGGGDETQRFLPEFQTLARRGVRVLRLIEMDLASDLQDALAQIIGGEPGDRPDQNARDEDAEHAAPAEQTQAEQSERSEE